MSEVSFSTKYFQSISNGLSEAQYYKQGIEVVSDVFFSETRDVFLKVKENNGRIFFLGNGASSAFANHMALDFSKNAKVLAHSLSDSALLTALANDFSFEEVFVEFLKIERISTKDLVITISSSGNSSNIIRSIEFCNLNGVNTLTLSGLNNLNASVISGMYSVFVPRKTYGIVECIHQIFLHLFLDELMDIEEWNKIESQNMRHSELRF